MKTRNSSAPAEPKTLSETQGDASLGDDRTPPPPADAPHALPREDEPGSRDPRDHDADGEMGGSAPTPEVQHLVMLSEDSDRGLSPGDVVAISPDDAGPLLVADFARAATAQEVELASPRIRSWAPAA